MSPEEFGLAEWGIADFGSIWKQVPFWADREHPPEHGTIVLLVGNDPHEDTILGDPDRPEERAPHFPAQYLNTRIWQVPDEMTITVDVPTSPDKNNWPCTKPETIDLLGSTGITRRPVRGAYHYIHHVGGEVEASSETEGETPVALGHGVRVHWFLRAPNDKRANPYGPRDGMVAVLYDDELYDISSEQYRFRQFGIRWKEVQRDTYLIIEPPPSDGHTPHGVYPLGGRDALNLYGGKQLPFSDWGMSFASQLPEPIEKRLQAAQPDQEDVDRSWKERFAERYLKRWRHPRLRATSNGSDKIDPTARAPHVDIPSAGVGADTARKPHRPRNVQHQLQSRKTTADRTGKTRQARKLEMAAAIPDWIRASAEDMDEPYYIAAYDPLRENTDGSRGVVLLNAEHEAVVAFVEEFQAKYPPQAGDRVEAECLNILGQSLVAKVVHAQSLSAHIPREEVEEKFLAPVALTTAAMEMVCESESVGIRIGGILGVRKAG